MKSIVVVFLIFSSLFGSVKSFEVTQGDTTKYQAFYENGKLRLEGIKVKKYRDGFWKHYDKNGKMIKADMYKMGIRVNSLDMSRKD